MKRKPEITATVLSCPDHPERVGMSGRVTGGSKTLTYVHLDINPDKGYLHNIYSFPPGALKLN